MYDLTASSYHSELLRSSGIDDALFPEIVASDQMVGELSAETAELLGLSASVAVVAGGVDNSCMALGAGSTKEGHIYNSLGSSSWIAVTSSRPVLDLQIRPYVFAHVVPGMFTSATSIFSAGTSLDWIRDQLCQSLATAQSDNAVRYEKMFDLAGPSPAGAHNLLFVPTLAGGTHFEGGPAVRGALVGLDLSHTLADILRAGLEGIAFGLRVALDELRRLTAVSDEMLMLGGGAKNALWRQIFADVYHCTVIKSQIDQETAALGAATLAAVGSGIWADYSRVAELHQIQDRCLPNPENASVYQRLLPVYKQAAQHQRKLSELLERS